MPAQAQAEAFTPGAALDDVFANLPDLASTSAASPTDSDLFGDLGMFDSSLDAAPQPAFSATSTPGSTLGSNSTCLQGSSFSAVNSAPLVPEAPPAKLAQATVQRGGAACNAASAGPAQGQPGGSGLAGNSSSPAVHSRPASRRRLVRRRAEPFDMPQPSSKPDVHFRRTAVDYDDI